MTTHNISFTKISWLMLLGCVWLDQSQAATLAFEEQNQIDRTVRFADPSTANELIVNNIFGSIDVTGYDGDEVRISATRNVRAKNQDLLNKGLAEVGLRVENLGQQVFVFLDLPLVEFNAATGDISYQSHWDRHRDPGYRHTLDIRIELPRHTSIKLSTINDGAITVSGVDAESLQVNNVNGPIDMVDVAGQTRVNAINKDINIAYISNPSADSSYETINGDLNINFAGMPDAEVTYQTMNGDLYTAFPVTALQPKVKVSQKQRSQGIKYKLDADARLQLGAGGATYQFKTLNGDITIQ